MEETSLTVELRYLLERMDAIYRSTRKADRQVLLVCCRKHSVIETNSYIPTDVLPQTQCDQDELLGTSVFRSPVPTKPRRQAEPTGMMSVLSMLTFSVLLWKELDQITSAPLGASLDSNYNCVEVWTIAFHQRMCDNHSLWNQEQWTAAEQEKQKKISKQIANVFFSQHKNTKENTFIDHKCFVLTA